MSKKSRKSWLPSDPRLSADTAVATLAYFKAKALQLEGMRKGSSRWKLAAREFPKLLHQMVCQCSAEQLASCADHLRPETQKTLRDLLEPKIRKAQSDVLLLNIESCLKDGQRQWYLIEATCKILEGYWWPRQIAPHLVGWESVIKDPDETAKQTVKEWFGPYVLAKADRRDVWEFLEHVEKRNTTRNKVPRGMWWYDEALAALALPKRTLTIPRDPMLQGGGTVMA